MSEDRRARLEAQRRGESYTYLHILNELRPVQHVRRPLLGLIQISSASEKRISMGRRGCVPDRFASSRPSQSLGVRRHSFARS